MHGVSVRSLLNEQVYIASGTVKWFNKQKGYGFVVPDNQEKDILVHGTVLKHSGVAEFPEGAYVILEVKNTPRGLRAQRILTVQKTKQV